MLIHHTILSASYTGGSSGLHHGIKFLAVSFFLASLAHHSFTGTRYRQNISPANDRYHSDGVLEDINLRSRYSLSDNDNDINEIDKGEQKTPEEEASSIARVMKNMHHMIRVFTEACRVDLLMAMGLLIFHACPHCCIGDGHGGMHIDHHAYHQNSNWIIGGWGE